MLLWWYYKWYYIIIIITIIIIIWLLNIFELLNNPNKWDVTSSAFLCVFTPIQLLWSEPKAKKKIYFHTTLTALKSWQHPHHSLDRWGSKQISWTAVSLLSIIDRNCMYAFFMWWLHWVIVSLVYTNLDKLYI